MINYRVGNQNDIQNISRLLIDIWRNCYKDFIPAEFLDHLQLDRQIQRHTKYMSTNTKYFIAENQLNELLGFSSYGQNRLENSSCEKELYTMYVKMNYQGKGIGTSLLNSVLSDLEYNQSGIVVSVFKDNPFKKFYVKQGFRKMDEAMIDMGKFKLAGEIYQK